MNFRNIIGATLAVLISGSAFAQYEEDVLRFSGAENSATARFNALGGQHTSMGGDLSSLYGNPAGLGMFSKSEFSLTTGFNNTKDKSNFLGINSSNSTFNPTINNIGIVFHSPVAKFNDNTKKGLVAVNYGIGYQKNNFFRNDLKFSGITDGNNLGDYLADIANYEDVLPNSLGRTVAKAGWQGYLIDDTGDGTSTPLYSPNTAEQADQNINVVRKGGQSNVDLSLGLNFGNNVYIGAGVGIASVNYKSQERLNEQGRFLAPQATYNANFLRSYDTQGSGVNFKIGAILRPSKEFRIGMSLETPTYYELTDNYYESVSYNDPDNKRILGEQDFYSTYNLRTPLKLNGGLSYIIGNKGFLSADINFVDYSGIKFSSTDGYLESSTNNYIQSTYQEVVNFGFGGEYKVSNEFAVRAGYRYI
ncbi:hypothetical protein EIM50_23060, partial [Pseudoxanthomonas sp. SGD-10]